MIWKCKFCFRELTFSRAPSILNNLVNRVFVRLGELDTKTNSCDNGGICAEPQDYSIESIVHHSNYDTPKYANDIAIIRLQKAVNLGMLTSKFIRISLLIELLYNYNQLIKVL